MSSRSKKAAVQARRTDSSEPGQEDGTTNARLARAFVFDLTDG